METIYRKLAISEEPKHNGNYHCIFPEGQIFTIPFLKEYGFHEEFTDCSGITHYLEEIPDPTAQLKADKAELLEALEKISKVTNEGYMTDHTDFQVWESELKQVHNEIKSLIQKKTSNENSNARTSRCIRNIL